MCIRICNISIAVSAAAHKGEITLQVYLAATPSEAQEAAPYSRTLVHVAYRIGPGSILLRQNLLLRTRGGLLSISDREAPPIEDPDALCAAVLRECGRRGYSGALLDFEEPPRKDRLCFAEKLAQLLSANHRTLYVTERYGTASASAVTLLCTAISGGNFSQYLQEAAAQRGGPGRLALDIQRLRMDFSLPARSGTGTPLSPEALTQLIEQESPSVFFSQDLCARYFTYTRNDAAHFVLFDDVETLRQKLRTGSAMGFSAAFFLWPEVRDIAGKLFSPPQK